MACSLQALVLGPQVVWSATTTALNHPLSPPLESSRFDKIRPTLELRGATANVQVKLAWRWSNDGISWGSWTTGGTAATSDGITHPAASPNDWIDPNTDNTSRKQFFQLGIECDGLNSTTINELGLVTLRIEFL